MQYNRIREMTLTKSEQMLFALLRASLHQRDVETTLFRECPDEEWRRCRGLAVKQGVMALAWDGVRRLPPGLQPPRPLKLAWAAAVERHEDKYRHYCETIVELSRFYERHGISVMQMKGVGLSAIYPEPSLREGGDIDIFTYSADKSRMSDAEANALADNLMREQNIEVDNDRTPKHSVFFYKGIPVENHKTFLNVESYKSAAQAEKALKDVMDPQPTLLPAGEILTPSPAFNTLFVSFHAAQHYGCGLALHHLCDWACLLKRYGLHMPAEITDRRFLHFVAALTLLSNRLLGTDIPLPDAPEKHAQKILEELLRPRYGAVVPAKSKAGIIAYKTMRLLHMIAVRREVLDESAVRVILSSVIAHIREPKTIFKRGDER